MWKATAEATKAVRWPESNLRLPATATAIRLCYTHASLQKRHTERGKREGGRHMRNICLPESRWAPQEDLESGLVGGGGGKIKEGVRETKGGQRGAAPRCQRPDSSCCHILSLIRQVSSSCSALHSTRRPCLVSSRLGAAAVAAGARGAAEIWSRRSQNRSLQSGLFNAC